MTTVAVLGAGSWGVALAQLCASNEMRTILWARREDAAQEIAATQSSTYLPGIPLSPKIKATTAPNVLNEADIILSAIPVQSTRAALSGLAPHIREDAIIVLCSKGIERGTLALPTDVVAEVLPGQPLAVLSGPSFAIDVVQGLPTAVTIAAESGADHLRDVFATPSFRPYPSTDIIGTQVGGAIKNVLAIGCGIVVARGLGESARAAMVARGFAEMTRLAVAMGAGRETLAGLSGLGDLVLTCGSERSRNFASGLKIGDPGYEGTARGVSEGSETAQAAVDLARKHDVALPICETVTRVLAGKISIEDGLTELMARPLKSSETG